jgi:predicted ester cyclase
MDVIDECFDEGYVSHTWQGDLAHTGARQARWFGAFEFLESLDDHVVAEGDLVVHHSRRRMRHVGDALGIPATGREVAVDHVEMWRVRGGKIVEHWGGMGVAGQLHRELTK